MAEVGDVHVEITADATQFTATMQECIRLVNEMRAAWEALPEELRAQLTAHLADDVPEEQFQDRLTDTLETVANVDTEV